MDELLSLIGPEAKSKVLKVIVDDLNKSLRKHSLRIVSLDDFRKIRQYDKHHAAYSQADTSDEAALVPTSKSTFSETSESFLPDDDDDDNEDVDNEDVDLN